MYILITNDDGIDAVGLHMLADAALKRGHRVLVGAPTEQQSAASQRINLNRPIMVYQHDYAPGTSAWAISGTPSDCVRVALELSDERPDVCFSGINDGENAGCATFYSGTLAAAREASMHGIPAFAVSIMPHADERMLATLAEKSIIMAENSDLSRFPRLGVVSVNAPAIAPEDLKGVRFAPASQAFYQDSYERRKSPRGQEYFWINSGLPMEEPEAGSDYDLLRQGYVTVSVLGGFADMNAGADRFVSIE